MVSVVTNFPLRTVAWTLLLDPVYMREALLNVINHGEIMLLIISSQLLFNYKASSLVRLGVTVVKDHV